MPLRNAYNETLSMASLLVYLKIHTPKVCFITLESYLDIYGEYDALI